MCEERFVCTHVCSYFFMYVFMYVRFCINTFHVYMFMCLWMHVPISCMSMYDYIVNVY